MNNSYNPEMLVYTSLFTLPGKLPKDNKYISMFYIWFSYLKRYAGLGPADCVGIIVDEETFDFMNSDGNQTFAYISEGVPFSIAVSVTKQPTNISEGLSERFNNHHFTQLPRNKLNLYLDIDCVAIRNIPALFKGVDLNKEFLFAMSEDCMDDMNHGGEFIKAGDLPYEGFPGLTSCWIGWTHSEDQRNLFDTVLKDCRERLIPLYTVDQPFYNREIFFYLTNKKPKSFSICLMDKELMPFNPYVGDSFLASAYFANFAGEPGVDDCHFTKMFAFMCMNFSTQPQPQPHQALPEPLPQQPPGSEPEPQQPPGSEPLPQQPPGSEPEPQQPPPQREHGLP
jgi:hypothetical protein